MNANSFFLLKKRGPGALSNHRGFSLIELVAVISVLSIMLFLTLPGFDVFSRQDDLKGAARWIMGQAPALKAKAMEDRKAYLLILDLDNNTMMVSSGEPLAEGEERPVLKSHSLSETVRLKAVTFPGAGLITSGQPEIRFYPKGYCDKAILHLQDGNNQSFSLVLEPFLNTVALVEGSLEFER
jgi:prepilin-type N-terminal cleavage/methylation domain-containing protein